LRRAQSKGSERNLSVDPYRSATIKIFGCQVGSPELMSRPCSSRSQKLFPASSRLWPHLLCAMPLAVASWQGYSITGYFR
jgi:hypothetical protein